MLTFPIFTNYSDDKVMNVWCHFPQYFNYILANFIGTEMPVSGVKHRPTTSKYGKLYRTYLYRLRL